MFEDYFLLLNSFVIRKMILFNKYFFYIIFSTFFMIPATGFSLDFSSDEWIASEVKITKGDSTTRFIYYYNGNGQKVLTTKYDKLSSGTYLPVKQTEWIYDNQLLTDEIHRNFKDRKALTNFRLKYSYNDGKIDLIETYDSINNLIATVDYIYNQSVLNQIIERKGNSQNQFTLTKQTDFEFTSLKTVETEKIYSDNNLTNSYLSIREFDASKRLSTLTYSVAKDTNFINDVKFIFSYINKKDTIIESIRKRVWDPNLNIWENTHKTVFKYTPSGKINTITSLQWESRFWRESNREVYEYNGSNELIYKSQQIPLYQKWRTLSKINYQLDDKTLIAVSEYDFWGGNSGELIATDIPVVFDNLNILVKADKVEINLIQTQNNDAYMEENDFHFYPNPSNGLLYLNNLQDDNLNVNVYSLNGQLMLKQNIKANSGVLDASILPNGNYILKLQNTKSSLNQKITISK